ncbi:MAG TPA: xanthine dehydrogenase family protein subunit M [Conexivisphaerales archaeon]|nr:xanthine dehydrogenase family protein subunit M [Conexivisphaerales archaeon]
MPVPRPFEYFAPASIEEAVGLVVENGDDAKVLAGGQSLVPLMKFRLASPKAVIDLGKHLKEELSYVREEDGQIRMGALTTHYDISASPIARDLCPMLAKAASDIGDYQVRNRGTIGGSLCHADPAAHYPPALTALGAQLVARGPRGRRVIPVSEFFRDLFTTSLAPDELLVEVRIPPAAGSHWGYEAIRGQGGSYSTAISAVLLKTDGATCSQATIVIGACTAVPFHAFGAEEILRDKTITAELVAEASAIARSELRGPLVDARVRADYRREMAALATRRALLAAVGGA